ncbi:MULTISPECIES: amidohydrolase family protein [Brevibacterium]|uniref:Predicted metal-dependent hydrolase, TIM-barrel fold n=1 Tax=Brevibacterium antiquum CNRZ 918 TaxID=1255637 RepID=A0A2H1IG50_9MICO|nr:MULTISPECIES: amidohydrolase family protein [Brevibacterium]SMX74131.1 Predicted metal-dependent hydrolase, TIM-barrel fold [Brevibacterium antiquum CNRZ 918]HCG56551.1 2-pyrone-4,6-dicarboxylate hydrolase [Brevibacterium sp.]
MVSATPVFDAHLHIIDPKHPLVENNGYLPDPFTVEDYLMRVGGLRIAGGLGIAGGAVVSGSFQGFDQCFLVDALSTLGPDFVGVTQLPADTSDDRILELDRNGVKALRFNVARGGSAALVDLDHMARRVHDLAGWHSELYVDARTIDEDLSHRIAGLPAVSIDHFGMHSDGLPALLKLVEQGVKVKATGFGRIELDAAAAMRAIVDVDPSALMVGTDLPSTRAPRPFENADFDIIRDTLSSEELTAVFWDNAAAYYLGRERG